MASPLVIARIEAWEAAGLIDPATATLLRDTEAAALEEPEAAERHPAAATRGPGITAAELFMYLGAAFVLGAWYALVASTVPYGEDALTRYGVAGLVTALVLGLTGIVLARRDTRLRRAAGASFLVALPNLGVGIFLVAGTVRPEAYPDSPTNALVASVVTLAAAVAARRFVPGLPTQFGLAATAATAGVVAMGWLDAVLFPRGPEEWEPAPMDEMAALVRVVLSMAWWWIVAVVMAVLLVVLDPHPRTAGRTRLGRVAVGVTAVLGTTYAVMIQHDWNAPSRLAGEPVLEPIVGAAILLAVSGVLLWLALNRASLGYLWPGGLGVFIALTWLNVEYLAVESGLWVGLLAEAVALFAVAFGVQRLGRRLQPSSRVQ